jgi:hypothetical protein
LREYMSTTGLSSNFLTLTLTLTLPRLTNYDPCWKLIDDRQLETVGHNGQFNRLYISKLNSCPGRSIDTVLSFQLQQIYGTW